jgi:type IV pilus assembly protein PilM
MPNIPVIGSLQPLLEGFLRQLTKVSPREPKLTVGLDIGSSAVKAVALGPRAGLKRRTVMGHKSAPLEEGGDAVKAVKTTVEALQLPVRTVNLSVSGQWVIMRVLEMPPMKPTELKQALPFEAQRYLPFNLDEVVVDGAVLGPSEGNKTWVLIVACKKELLTRRMDCVKQAGFEPVLVDVDALALANAFLACGVNGASPEDQRTALIDVGAHLTNLVVFKGTAPYLVRDILWGGQKMARQVAEQLGTEVEHVTKELSQGQPSAELTNAMRVTCEGLVSELQLSFDYFENRFGHQPDTVLVSGGVSHCAPFLDAMKTHFPQPVTPWAPSVDGLAGEFAVAYGLALRVD